jgi:fructokinase
VLVVGEALVDLVPDDSGTPVAHPGGSPMNVAFGLGRLGVPTALLTRLGDDDHGVAIAAHLEAAGVALLPESRAGGRTSSARIELRADGSASYTFDIDWTLAPIEPPEGVRIVHTGSIAAFLRPGADAVGLLLQTLRDEALVTYDPNIRPALVGDHDEAVAMFEAFAEAAHVVKLSDEDAAWLYPDRELDAVLSGVLGLGPELAVATRGADGAVLMSRGARVDVPAVRVDVVDTIGAGDAFMSALIARLADAGVAADPERIAALDEQGLRGIGGTAVRAAALTVARAGARPPTRAELDADPDADAARAGQPE